jgi:hypothetical protein
MKTPEEIARNCVIQYCTPDEYDAAVKSAIAAAIRAEREEFTARTKLLREAVKLIVDIYYIYICSGHRIFEPNSMDHAGDLHTRLDLFISNPSVQEMMKGEEK